MEIRGVVDYLESLAPLHLQESYDNCGLIVGDVKSELTGILTTLDTTEEIVLEAKRKNCNLIVSHHPIIFKGLKTLTPDTYVERTVIMALRNDISIYAIHTNLDNILENGVNEKIAQQLGLDEMQILLPKSEDTKEVGSGIIGILPQAIPSQDFLENLKIAMKCQVVRHTRPTKEFVRKIAACGGSGSFLLKTAISRGADVFVSADFKYHEFFDAEDNILIADIGHFESEQYTARLLADLFKEKFRTFAVHFSEISTNPIKYFF